MNRNGEIAIQDEQGRDRERNSVIYGTRFRATEGLKVAQGTIIAEWDPYTIPIITEVSGIVRFGDIEDGKTMKEQVDEVTGLSSKVIVQYREVEMRPRVSIKDETGKTIRIPRHAARGALPLAGRRHIDDSGGATR